MKGTCKFLGILTLILGIIGSFVLAYALGSDGHRFYSDRNWVLTIILFVSGVISTAIPSTILLGISEVLEGIESVKFLQNNPEESSSFLNKLVEEKQNKTFWKCPNCGKSNPPYTGTCSCGCAKP